jgi:hypothetical protein
MIVEEGERMAQGHLKGDVVRVRRVVNQGTTVRLKMHSKTKSSMMACRQERHCNSKLLQHLLLSYDTSIIDMAVC